MSKTRYKYTKIHDGGIFGVATYRPLLPVTLRYNKDIFPTFGLADTGADFCLFPSGIAEALGINLENCRKVDISGVGAKIKAFISAVDLEINNKIFPTPILFSSMYKHDYPLLGQYGFFNNYKVKFDYKNKYIWVQDN